MITVLSPAKTLDYETQLPTDAYSMPSFLSESGQLIEQLKTLEPWQIQELMSISEDLAVLNANRFQTWKVPFTPENARPALFAFKGDVYTGLDAYQLSDKDIAFAQNHLRMLSGLYGLLKPLDLIQPYRLEMGTRYSSTLPNGDVAKNLYEFWGLKITEALNADLEAQDGQVLLNLASNEYFKAVKKKALNGRIVSPVFKDLKNGRYKVVSFWAKKARGAMARFIVTERIHDPELLKDAVIDGYEYRGDLSNESEWVFCRDQAPVAG